MLTPRCRQGSFAGEFAGAVDAERVRLVFFGVWSLRRAVKHKVRADVKHSGTVFGRQTPKDAHSRGINRPGRFRFRLRTVHVCVSGAVDDKAGNPYRLGQVRLAAHVEVRQVKGDGLDPPGAQRIAQGGPQHAASPEDRNPAR